MRAQGKTGPGGGGGLLEGVLEGGPALEGCAGRLF